MGMKQGGISFELNSPGCYSPQIPDLHIFSLHRLTWVWNLFKDLQVGNGNSCPCYRHSASTTNGFRKDTFSNWSNKKLFHVRYINSTFRLLPSYNQILIRSLKMDALNLLTQETLHYTLHIIYAIEINTTLWHLPHRTKSYESVSLQITKLLTETSHSKSLIINKYKLFLYLFTITVFVLKVITKDITILKNV